MEHEVCQILGLLSLQPSHEEKQIMNECSLLAKKHGISWASVAVFKQQWNGFWSIMKTLTLMCHINLLTDMFWENLMEVTQVCSYVEIGDQTVETERGAMMTLFCCGSATEVTMTLL